MSAILHAYTDHSLKQSVLKIKDYVRKAKEKGYKRLAITDIATMTGIFEFKKECEINGIIPIIGVTAYVGSNTKDGYYSVVFLAKNYIGYQNLCRAVTESHKTVYVDENKNTIPIMPFSVMKTYLSDGNVIALSSLMTGGIIKGMLLKKKNKRKIEDLKALLKTVPNPKDEGYQKNIEKIGLLDDEIDNLKKAHKSLINISNKDLSKKLLALEVIGDKTLYDAKKEQIDKELLQIETAKSETVQIEAEIKRLTELRKVIKRKVTSTEKKHIEYHAIQTQIEDESNKDILDFIDVMKYFQNVFRENYYIEITYHNDDEEYELFQMIIEKAKELRISMVAQNEVMMAEKDDFDALQIMYSMQGNEYTPLNNTYKERYIKSTEEFKTDLNKVINGTLIEEVCANIDTIADMCNIEFPNIDKHPLYIEDGAFIEDAADLLRKRAEEGIALRGFTDDTFTETYKNRMEHELSVIISMGFAGYLLIVQDYVMKGKELAKENPYHIGAGVGDGRGSAAGSLICYLLGITTVDPILYNLKFERFLNTERVSMPDIDVDFSAEIRMKCAEYVSEKYGKESVAFIRTVMTQKAKACLRNVARIIGDRDFNDTKHFLSLGDRMAKTIPIKDTKARLKDYKDDIYHLKDGVNDEYIEIIYETALKVEGIITGIGIHAAGIIIGNGNPLSDYVPLLYNHEMKVWAIQCDMVEAEEYGLLKMDFLGLKNLDVISDCIRRIKKYTGKEINLDTIPFEKEVFDEIFCEGKTNCVFQFESEGMKEMLRKFKPSSFEDIVLLVSAYRPGPMDSIPKIIESKFGLSKPYYCIKELEDILSPTYGYPIYQEQLMDIFHVCAGFSQGEADIIRRYMSKKKVDKFLAEKSRFINGLKNHGASESDANELWESLVSFAEYAFNKSHAVAYAKISYQTAYLKYHYPKYYMCAVLNVADTSKYESLICECKELGIPLLLPDINRSGMGFENVADGILYGLGKIKTIKDQIKSVLEERNKEYFPSFKDFVRRSHCSEKLTLSLIDSGCFDCFGSSRKGLKIAYNAIKSLLNEIEAKRNKIAAYENKLMINPKKVSLKQNIEVFKKELSHLETKYREYCPIKIDEDDSALDLEYNMLCAYISSHPLDNYRILYKKQGIRLLAESESSVGVYIGMVKNLRIAQRKTDKANMAFFTLEDISGSMEVCCFVKAYQEFGNLLKDRQIIEITAKRIEEETEDGSIRYSLVVRKIKKIKIEKSPIFISIKERSEEPTLYSICKEYEDESGHPIILHYADTGEIKPKKMGINRTAIDEIKENFFVKILFEYQKYDYSSKNPY